MIIIILCAVAGFALSLYLFTVEQKLKSTGNYHPACNINDRFSCTKPMQSPYGKIFGFSNSVLGLMFYPMLIVLALFGYTNLLFYASIGLILFSAFLAYLLLFKVKALCPVCLTIYAINITIFIAAFIGAR